MVPHSPRSRWMLGTKEFTKNMKITTLRTDTHFTRSTLSVILCCWGETTSHVWAIVKFVRNWIWNPLSSAVLGCFAPSFYPPEKFVCRKPQPINILIGCYFRKLKDSWICLGGVQPLEGFHQLAQQILQVEDLLHQEAFHSRLLSAGRVNALSRLPPHQDLMLEFWKSMTPRAEEKNCSLMHLKHISTHTHTHNAAQYDGNGGTFELQLTEYKDAVSSHRRANVTRERTYWLCRYNHNLCRYQWGPCFFQQRLLGDLSGGVGIRLESNLYSYPVRQEAAERLLRATAASAHRGQLGGVLTPCGIYKWVPTGV